MQIKLDQTVQRGACLKTPQGQFFLMNAQLTHQKKEYGLELFFCGVTHPKSTWLSFRITHFAEDPNTRKLYFAYSTRNYLQVVPADLYTIKKGIENARSEYLQRTNVDLPIQSKKHNWPIHENHCFQRILLDHLFLAPWYTILKKNQNPAYQQLNIMQLSKLLMLTQKMQCMNKKDITALNQVSIKWRKRNPKH
ncbi:MAG: hypothetical protein HRU40_12915 [Saprospiraceae bacterium]|nr:hypothetical protein [Saprospiraceae bacterium]